MIFIYKFCKKENLIQPSGEPRGQHLGEFQQITSKLDMDSYFFIYQLNQLFVNNLISYYIILYYSSVFLGSGFHNPNYLEI